jgi:hypothetical protein
MEKFPLLGKNRFRVKLAEDIEIIQGSHPHVNPFRSQTSASIFLPRKIGFFISYNYGHDDYNPRFVDSGHHNCKWNRSKRTFPLREAYREIMETQKSTE